ncbi:bifunctional metallophosphatase/5'-nucleotidase [bacterium]|nr:bifunctional metallophosphatase/5'-nucleotidase [bacterium]
MKKTYSIIFLFIFSLIFAQNDIEHIIILHTNDIHGGIGPATAFWMNPEFPPKLGGAASITTLIKEVKKEAEKTGAKVLVADIGDIWQGTPVGERTQGQAVLDFFEKAGYQFWILGNHDFDKGMDAVKHLVESSKSTVLCANLVENETGEIPKWKNLQPYKIFDYGDVKIGIIGIITDDMPTLEPKENLEGFGFKLTATTLMEYRDELREMGCDIIIDAGHTGISYHVPEKYSILIEYEKAAMAKGLKYGTKEFVEYIYKKKGFGLQDQDLAELVPGIDVILGGHSHTGLYPPYEDPRNHTLVVQAYSHGSALGRLDLYIDKNHKRIIKYSGTNYTPFVDSAPPDKAVEKMVNDYIAKNESDLQQVVGIARKPVSRGNDETILGDLIADALRWKYKTDFALFNRGGMRADLPSGEIIGKDIYQTLPFGNTAVVVKISGADLVKILQIGFSGKRRDTQISGVRVVYNPNFSTKNKLCDAKFVDGTPIVLDKQYTMVTSNYLAAGAVGYSLLKQRPQDNSFTPIRVALTEYIKIKTPLDASLDGRTKRDKKAVMNEDFEKILKKLVIENEKETTQKKKEIIYK